MCSDIDMKMIEDIAALHDAGASLLVPLGHVW
jgi:hypothetical protein